MSGNNNQNPNQESVDGKQASADLTSLIKDGKVKEAIALISQGVKTDVHCYYALFKQCMDGYLIEDLEKVYDSYCESIKRKDFGIGCEATVISYRCRKMIDTHKMFTVAENFPDQNKELWALIHRPTGAFPTSCIGYPCMCEAFRIDAKIKVQRALEFIDQVDVVVDIRSLYALIDFCGDSKSLVFAKELHGYFLSLGIPRDQIWSKRIMLMYGKCKSVVDARKVFDDMPLKDVNSFNIMMDLYASLRMKDEALQLLKQMPEMGLTPDEDTLHSAMTAITGQGFNTLRCSSCNE